MSKGKVEAYIYIHGELPARFKRQMNVNDASQLKKSKQAKSGPKQKFYDQNRRWNTFPTSMSFSSYGSPMIVPWGTYFGMPYSHVPWFHNSYMSFLATYLYPNYVTYRVPAISEPAPTNNDRFVQKNWSVQKNKYKVIKQVYRVKKDGRLNKNSDSTLDKEKTVVEEQSDSSISKIVPNDDHDSNNVVEQCSSSAGGGAR